MRRLVPRSGRPAGRSAARRVAGINRPKPRRKPVQRDDGTSTNSPYDDLSRDVGEGPDGLTKMQTFVLWFGILFGIYLWSASCGTAVDHPPVEHRCHLCHEFKQ